MRTDAEFDDILNDALAEYREAEPLAGLEDRVLRRAGKRNGWRRKRRWAWTIGAAAVAALLAIAVWLGMQESAQRRSGLVTMVQQKETMPEIRREAPKLASQKPLQKQWMPAQQKSVHVRRGENAQQDKLVGARTAPRRSQFPTPAPLTADERALLTLAQTDPQALQTSPHDDQEIAIAPLEIKPLAEDAGSQGDN